MYYVYELVDPRDGRTFYVGKGTGDRPKDHIRDAKRGKPGAKCQRIREILSSGLEIGVAVIREFTDEARAYAFEKRRIAAIGAKNLSNIAPGGGSVRVAPIGKDQPKASREEVIALFSRIAARPEPRQGMWAAALHRAVVRALPRLIENRS